jgi:rod shape determining protein RodA
MEGLLARTRRQLRLFQIDWPLLVSALALCGAGLITMNSFAEDNIFFDRQLIWIGLSVLIFLVASRIDYRFLRRSWPVALLYGVSVLSLVAVYFFGDVVKGAQSRFDFGFFAVQPSDPMKLVLIIVLAKYFARRHVEIANFKHILVSGIYAFIPFALILLQPDLGSALILASIWLGIVLVAGISRTHLLTVFLLGAAAAGLMWGYVLEDYQKARVMTFINPLADIQGDGYNAYQSMIAVGSGELLGQGIGYGTQSKLRFLPEYQTDFIFAAFAEEWGFIGVIMLFILFGIVLWRILRYALRGGSNFETLFAVGVAVMFLSHFIVHVGINMGLLPVTGTTVPFLSYGGSHLMTEFLALGILMGMRRYARAVHEDEAKREFIGAFSIDR